METNYLFRAYYVARESATVICVLGEILVSQVEVVVKNLPPNAGDIRDAGSIPGSRSSLEEGMATHSSILAWRIPWTGEPGKLHTATVSQRVRHEWSALACTQGQNGKPLSVQFSCSVMSNSLWPDGLKHAQVSLSITNSQSLLKLMSMESVMPSNHLILCRPLLLLPSIFPSIKIFSGESALRIRWPKYWRFSFSISPSNEHPGLISFRMDCSPRDSQESSSTPQFKGINSSALSFLYSPTLTSIHDYWKNHSFDYTDLCL